MSEAARSVALCLAVVLVLSGCGCASPSDDPQGTPSGVIPYACVDGAALVLLAFDSEPKRRGWGQFGGTPKHGESIPETAAREFHEEANCAFAGPGPEELALLAPSESRGFFSFFAEVPYRSPAEIAADRPACPDVERSRWVWVRHADLVHALAAEGATRLIPTAVGDTEAVHLWSGAAASLRRAREEGVLPDADPCR